MIISKESRDRIDKIALEKDSDPELASGIDWLEEQALKRGISIYEMIVIVIERKESKDRAKKWLEKR